MTTTYGLIPSISIDALLAARDQMIAAFDTARDNYTTAKESLAVFGVDPPKMCMQFDYSTHRDVCEKDYQEAMRREIDRHIWLRLFKLTNIDTILDTASRKELHDKLYTNQGYTYNRQKDELPPLTRENIESTFLSLHAQRDEFFGKAVEEVYRSLSWDHKTNVPFAFGLKLILNYAVCSYSHSSSSARLNYNNPLEDLERVLHLLDGEPTPFYGVGARSMDYIPYGEWVEIPAMNGESYMSIKIHKKGTCHVLMTNEDLVRKMNRVMSSRYPGQIRSADYVEPKAKKRTVSEPGRRSKKERQAFYTPAVLADLLAKDALKAMRVSSFSELHSILEPSCGEGALVLAAHRLGAGVVDCIDNDVQAAEKLSMDKVSFRLADFLSVAPNPIYDFVLMNPPFSRGLDAEHVMHAWKFLRPGGVLAAIVSQAAAHRKDGPYRELGALLGEPGNRVEMNEPKAFAESGTHVRTARIILHKP